MNGRVYDPFLARMISADPTVPGPFNGQAFNRYAYVFNNPLSLVDPSGFGPELGPLGTPHADGSGGVTLDPVAVNGEPVDDDRFPTDNGGASPTSSLSAFNISGMSALSTFNPTGVTDPGTQRQEDEDDVTSLDTVQVVGRCDALCISLRAAGTLDAFNYFTGGISADSRGDIANSLLGDLDRSNEDSLTVDQPQPPVPYLPAQLLAGQWSGITSCQAAFAGGGVAVGVVLSGLVIVGMPHAGMADVGYGMGAFAGVVRSHEMASIMFHGYMYFGAMGLAVGGFACGQ